MPGRHISRSIVFLIALLAALQAHAQTIVATPGTLSFSVQARGATSPPQMVQITSSGANFSFTASPQVTAPWLIVSQSAGTTPATLSVSVNPTVLLAAGLYNAQISVAAPGTANTPLLIPVIVSVAGGTQVTVNPAALTFSSQAGAPTPPQILNISTGGVPGNFLISAASQGNWLAVDRSNGVSPSDVLVSVTPGSLAAGSYSGNLTITVPGAVNSPVNVPVTLNITSAAQLTAAPAGLSFNFQVGQGQPAMQQLFVSSGTASIPFNVTASTSGGGTNWLVVNSVTSATPGIANIGVNPANLAAGIYNGTLTVSSPSAASITVPVTLTVSALPLLTVNPTTVAFNYQVGGPLLGQQTVAISSSSGTINYTAAASTTSGGPWLQISPTNASTPSQLTLIADPTGLPAGTYNGAVTLTLAGAGVSTVTLPVTLTVTTTPMLTATPNPVSFFAQTGGANPAAQTISVGSTSGVLTFASLATTSSGGNWLTATGSGPASAATPGLITVTANAAGLATGTYNGTVTISSPASTGSIQVPVSLTVSTLPLLTISPTTLSFLYQAGGSVPVGLPLSIGSTTTALPFSIVTTTTDGANWLSVSQSTGTSPATVTVSVNPAGLRPGNYTGTLAVNSLAAGNPTQNITVSLTVAAPALTINPAALVFNQQMSGPAPASQVLTVTNAGSTVSYTTVAATSSGGNWLSITPANGMTPGIITVMANGGGLAAGTYNGTVTVNPVTPFGPTGGGLSIPVMLVVGAPQNLSVTPATITFGYQAGSASTPASQTVTVAASTPLPFTVSAASTGNWLSASPASGTAATPGVPVTIAVNPAGLPAGTYNGTVTIASTAASNSPQVVAVTLVITAIPPPSLTALVNAASFLNGPVSPGEIVTLGGTGIGPATLTGIQLTPSGTVDTTVAGTRVLFDGNPAPIIYVSSTQLSVVVPYALAGRATAQAQVIVNGVASNLFGVAVAPSAPGIFTLNSAGSGPGAILNENGSVNTSSNPTTVGKVIVIYATGEGATNPAGSDGAVIGGDLRTPVLPVTVTIGGKSARVNYQGSAPGLVAGVLQVNAVVPEGAGTGDVSVLIKSGNNMSQPNVTVALQ